jgi:hypothetical protein
MLCLVLLQRRQLGNSTTGIIIPRLSGFNSKTSDLCSFICRQFDLHWMMMYAQKPQLDLNHKNSQASELTFLSLTRLTATEIIN